MFPIVPALMTNSCYWNANQTNPEKSLKVGIIFIILLS